MKTMQLSSASAMPRLPSFYPGNRLHPWCSFYPLNLLQSHCHYKDGEGISNGEGTNEAEGTTRTNAKGKKMIRGPMTCKRCGEKGHRQASAKCPLNGTAKKR
jgi:hypothetical protein